jgi:hypothetical protein
MVSKKVIETMVSFVGASAWTPLFGTAKGGVAPIPRSAGQGAFYKTIRIYNAKSTIIFYLSQAICQG